MKMALDLIHHKDGSVTVLDEREVPRAKKKQPPPLPKGPSTRSPRRPERVIGLVKCRHLSIA